MTDEQATTSDRASAIVSEALDIWLAQGKRWYDRSSSKSTWSPEDVVGDTTDLMEHLTPLWERSINLGLDLARPWAKTFEARANETNER